MSVYSTVSTLANSTTGESSTDTGSVLTLRSNQIQIGNLEFTTRIRGWRSKQSP